MIYSVPNYLQTVPNNEAQSGVVRFGPYEVRPATRELFRQGVRVRLPPQSFEVLRILLERRGALVTRQEFHQFLWPADTFVDFDQGLNNAIKRIREVLNDSTESPLYIETLPRLGYRFIGTVESTPEGEDDRARENGSVYAQQMAENSQPPGSSVADLPTTIAAPPSARRAASPARWMVTASLAGVMVSLAVAWQFRPYYPPPRLTDERQLTTDGLPKWGQLVTDGQRLYYTEILNGHQTVAAVPISGGQAVPLKMPFTDAGLFGISPDRNDLLVAETPDMFTEARLWRVPIIGGTPRRLGNVAAHDASWSPDGTRLAYTVVDALYVANADGSDPRRLPTPTPLPDQWAWRPTWSSDSRRLRFDCYQMPTHLSHIWEVSADGKNLHPVFAVSSEWTMQAGGEWTPDSRYYVFAAWKDLESGIPWPASDLWAAREKTSLFHRTSSTPTKLTTGPIRFYQYVFSSDGKTILALSSLKHGELMRYDARAKSFFPWLGGLSAEGVTFSRDGQWIAYVTYPQGELWRSRIDGSEPLRLSARPLFASSPAWFPDGSEIAFAGVRAGERGHAWSVSANGGEPRRISAIAEGNDPSWTPDGNSLLYLDTAKGDSNTAISLRNLRTGAVSAIPGSRGFWMPRMSPDGRWIAALSNDLGKLLVFDFHTQAWREVASGVNWPRWSHDSKYLYFSRVDANPQIYRAKASGGAPELVVTLKDFRITGEFPGWFSLTPQDDVLVLHDTGGGTEIYALSWDAP